MEIFKKINERVLNKVYDETELLEESGYRELIDYSEDELEDLDDPFTN